MQLNFNSRFLRFDFLEADAVILIAFDRVRAARSQNENKKGRSSGSAPERPERGRRRALRHAAGFTTSLYDPAKNTAGEILPQLNFNADLGRLDLFEVDGNVLIAIDRVLVVRLDFLPFFGIRFLIEHAP